MAILIFTYLTMNKKIDHMGVQENKFLRNLEWFLFSNYIDANLDSLLVLSLFEVNLSWARL